MREERGVLVGWEGEDGGRRADVRARDEGARTEVRDAGQLHFVHELAQPLPVVLLREHLEQVVQLRALLPAQRLHAAAHRHCHGERERAFTENAPSQRTRNTTRRYSRVPSDRRRSSYEFLYSYSLLAARLRSLTNAATYR